MFFPTSTTVFLSPFLAVEGFCFALADFDAYACAFAVSFTATVFSLAVVREKVKVRLLFKSSVAWFLLWSTAYGRKWAMAPAISSKMELNAFSVSIACCRRIAS